MHHEKKETDSPQEALELSEKGLDLLNILLADIRENITLDGSYDPRQIATVSKLIEYLLEVAKLNIDDAQTGVSFKRQLSRLTEVNNQFASVREEFLKTASTDAVRAYNSVFDSLDVPARIGEYIESLKAGMSGPERVRFGEDRRSDEIFDEYYQKLTEEIYVFISSFAAKTETNDYDELQKIGVDLAYLEQNLLPLEFVLSNEKFSETLTESATKQLKFETVKNQLENIRKVFDRKIKAAKELREQGGGWQDSWLNSTDNHPEECLFLIDQYQVVSQSLQELQAVHFDLNQNDQLRTQVESDLINSGISEEAFKKLSDDRKVELFLQLQVSWFVELEAQIAEIIQNFKDAAEEVTVPGKKLEYQRKALLLQEIYLSNDNDSLSTIKEKFQSYTLTQTQDLLDSLPKNGTRGFIQTINQVRFEYWRSNFDSNDEYEVLRNLRDITNKPIFLPPDPTPQIEFPAYIDYRDDLQNQINMAYDVVSNLGKTDFDKKLLDYITSEYLNPAKNQLKRTKDHIYTRWKEIVSSLGNPLYLTRFDYLDTAGDLTQAEVSGLLQNYTILKSNHFLKDEFVDAETFERFDRESAIKLVTNLAKNLDLLADYDATKLREVVEYLMSDLQSIITIDEQEADEESKHIKECFKILNNKLSEIISVESELDNIYGKLRSLNRGSIRISDKKPEFLRESYQALRIQVEELKRNKPEAENNEDIKKLERDIEIGEFNKTWENYDIIFDNLEIKNISAGNGTEYLQIIDDWIMPRLFEIAGTLSDMYQPSWINDEVYGHKSMDSWKRSRIVEGSEYFLDQFYKLKASYGPRKALYFTWSSLNRTVIGDVVSFPENLDSEDGQPMNGVTAKEFLAGGFVEHGDNPFNVPVGRYKVHRIPKRSDYIKRGRKYVLRPGLEEYQDPHTKEKLITETVELNANAFCMNIYDSIFRGDYQPVVGSDQLNYMNIHDKNDLAIQHAWERVNAVLGRDVKKGDEPLVPELVALRAFRFVSVVFHHNSILSRGGTVGASNKFFYAAKWHEYFAKYRKSGESQSNRLATGLILGESGHDPSVDGKNHFKNIDSVAKKYAQRVKNNPQEGQYLYKERGYNPTNPFGFLASTQQVINPGYYYNPKTGKEEFSSGHNYSTGYKLRKDRKRGQVPYKFGVDAYFMAPLLARLSIDPRVSSPDPKIYGDRAVIIDELEKYNKGDRSATPFGVVMSFFRLRAYGEVSSDPTHEYGKGWRVDNDGNIRVVNAANPNPDESTEMAVAPGDTFLYPIMPFEKIMSKFHFNYLKDALSGMVRFWKLLYSDRKEFASSMSSPHQIQSLRTAMKYSMSCFDGFCQESKYGNLSGKQIMNELVMKLILAHCLTQTSEETDIKERWDAVKLFNYLDMLRKNDAILPAEQLVLYDAVLEQRRGKIRMDAFIEEFITQMRNSVKWN